MQAAKKRSLTSLLVLVLILAMAAYITASLGFWQLDRARQKHALAMQFEQGAALPSLDLNLEPLAQAEAWQPARVRGEWLPGVSLMLDNRALMGRPGYWVLGVLALPSERTHVAVLRGWIERRFEGLPSWETPDGVVQLEGRVLSHVPRLYELKPDPALNFSSPDLPVVQNVDIEQLEQASGLDFLPFILQQTSASPDGLQRHWEAPVFDTNKHRGYALQWFLFAGFALFVLGVAVVRFIRSARH